MPQITIYHNPRCSKSRQALQLLQENGASPVIIEYLETPPSVEELSKIIKLLAISPRELLRKREVAYEENDLANQSLSDKEIIEIMHKNPSLIERPIIAADNRAVIARSPDKVKLWLTFN